MCQLDARPFILSLSLALLLFHFRFCHRFEQLCEITAANGDIRRSNECRKKSAHTFPWRVETYTQRGRAWLWLSITIFVQLGFFCRRECHYTRARTHRREPVRSSQLMNANILYYISWARSVWGSIFIMREKSKNVRISNVNMRALNMYSHSTIKQSSSLVQQKLLLVFFSSFLFCHFFGCLLLI